MWKQSLIMWPKNFPQNFKWSFKDALHRIICTSGWISGCYVVQFCAHHWSISSGCLGTFPLHKLSGQSLSTDSCYGNNFLYNYSEFSMSQTVLIVFCSISVHLQDEPDTIVWMLHDLPSSIPTCFGKISMFLLGRLSLILPSAHFSFMTELSQSWYCSWSLSEHITALEFQMLISLRTHHNKLNNMLGLLPSETWCFSH